jgi:hypothetical protein
MNSIKFLFVFTGLTFTFLFYIYVPGLLEASALQLPSFTAGEACQP